jgi:hypothetical protein
VDRTGLTRRWLRDACRAAVLAGTAGAVLGTAHTVRNLGLWRVPTAPTATVIEPVSVLLPVRDEAERVASCLASVLAQQGLADLEVLVLSDGSTDGTAALARAAAGDDPRVRVIESDGSLPPGWLGKPWACERLARLARGAVLVFVDADVLLEPAAVAATVALLREADLDLVSPYPRQVCGSTAERLVQPLLQWSFLTTVPLAAAERRPRPSTAVANGQLLAVDAEAYRAAGGHAAVRGEVLDDVALLRAVIRSGGTGTVVDGTHLATCRMYEGWTPLAQGYSKSLWSAFGSPAGAVAVQAGLGLLYVVPAVAALGGSRTGLVGFAAGVTGRALVASRVGGRVWPDSLAHPLSVAVLAGLTARSLHGRRHGTLRWKGRTLA